MAVLGAYNFDEASGAVLDRSGNGHSFTLAGNSIRDGAGHTANGARSTSTSIDAGPGLYGQTTNRTLMMWLKMSADFTGWCFEMHLNGPDSGAWGLLCLSGQLGYRARNAAGNTAFASAARKTDNAWHHYAGTWDGTTCRLYTDGVLTSSATLSGGGSGPIATADVINLFSVAVGTPPIIDDVRVLDEVLDAAAITALMGTPVSDVSTVLGTGVATLGGITGSAVGRRTAAGQAITTFGSLAAVAIGSRTVTAVASAALGKVNAFIVGAPVKLGTAIAALGKVTGTALGSRTASGTGNAPLSGLLATATGGSPESVQGAGVAVLGALSAAAQVHSVTDELWLTDADLASARADQESIMYDRLRIRHDDPVDGEFDIELGYAPSELPEPFYVGRGRVQARPVQSSERLIAASQEINLLGYAVAVPWNVTGIRPTDIIEVYESRDPENVGKTLRVSDVQSSTYVTARRMQCIDYQRREVTA
jgi:hypothetical protein